MSFSKYEREDTILSPYLYPDTRVLINKLGIHDEILLLEAEAILTGQRVIELAEKGITGRFTVSHFKNIHKYLFSDLYSFAGKFRTENISKGNTVFCRWENINSNLRLLISNLKVEKYLVDLGKNDFCKRLAHYFAELNLLHPYREGNGRATREFIRQLSANAGHKILWELVVDKEMLNSMLMSVSDEKCLADYLTKIIE